MKFETNIDGNNQSKENSEWEKLWCFGGGTMIIAYKTMDIIYGTLNNVGETVSIILLNNE